MVIFITLQACADHAKIVYTVRKRPMFFNGVSKGIFESEMHLYIFGPGII